ncbi:unnamed protein product [Symbiodinium pilosum]|uniref:Uncharacterized protein n=1 Tax=Symbiodinium pilosum TaxID=2952 RepID=A0A812JD84_SYMPI|nr:unnamed protein product [Symbiodinium pilosum]
MPVNESALRGYDHLQNLHLLFAVGDRGFLAGTIAMSEKAEAYGNLRHTDFHSLLNLQQRPRDFSAPTKKTSASVLHKGLKSRPRLGSVAIGSSEGFSSGAALGATASFAPSESCETALASGEAGERIPVAKSYFLFFETGCAKHKCIRSERLEVQSVFKVYGDYSAKVWLITGLAFAWGTLLLTALQVRQWMTPVFGLLQPDRGHSIARLTAVVLLLPATYGVCAAGALRVITTNREDTWTAEALMDVAELFSAIALYSFQRLLIVYVDVLHADSPKAAVKAEPDQIRHSFQKVMSVGIQQYVVLQFACNSILVAVKAWDWVHPSSCEDALQGMMGYVFPRHNISLAVNEAKLRDTIHTRTSSLACEDVWNAISLLMVVADFFTCSIALFAVLQYEHAFSDALRPVRPFWKFWGVKGLLSVNFMQTSILTAPCLRFRV